jgi:hypothetical protein
MVTLWQVRWHCVDLLLLLLPLSSLHLTTVLLDGHVNS